MLTSLRRLGPRTAWALALVAPAIAGCESAHNAPIEVTEVTANEHLDNVMRRLEFALQGAQAAAASDAIVKRECAYKLIEPAQVGDDYAAEVTIRTTISLAPPPGVQPIQSPAADAKVRAVSDVVEAAGAPTVASVVYKLAYKNQRWELVDPPQDKLPETEADCFLYALSDG